MNEKAWGKLKGEALAKEILRMEIYAAMLDRVDQNIGKIQKKLKNQGKLDNTFIIFASDNGACAEGSGAKRKSNKIEDFGKVASYETVGKNWATVQNTPLRHWKNYSHEGGIRTPFIVNWPGKIKNPGGFYTQPAHFIDIMPTLVALTGAKYPTKFDGKKITPMQGVSLLPALEGKSLQRKQPIFWQWSRGGGIRKGNMKAVFWNKKWELYDMSENHNETKDLAANKPELLQNMKTQ